MRPVISGVLVVFGLAASVSADAASIRFSFSGGSPLGTSTFGSAISGVGPWSLRDSNGELSFVPAAQGTGWHDGDGNAFYFEFVVAANYTVTFSTVDVGEAAELRDQSKIGPTTRKLTFDGAYDATGTTHGIDPSSLPVVSASEVIFYLKQPTLGPGSHVVEFAGFGASDPEAFWRMYYFEVTGSAKAAPVPVPMTVWLTSSSFVGLVPLVRRRKAS